MSPEQERFPLLFVTVHPVAETPPASSTSPVLVLPICTLPVDPASSVKLEVPPALTAPPAANVRLVEFVVMVSIEETPVKAPAVVTFNPPLLVNANVPVALPIDVFPVPVPSETVPLPLTVKLPEFWV